MTTLAFLCEFAGANDPAFTRQGVRSDVVENDLVHMPGL